MVLISQLLPMIYYIVLTEVTPSSNPFTDYKFMNIRYFSIHMHLT